MKESIYDSVSFCKHCLEHGLCCGITETTVEERRRLVAVRDSLKDILDMHVFLQTLESRKQQRENAAFARLEASRLFLVDRVNQYPGHGRKVDALEELNSWFTDKETPFTWKYFKERNGEDTETAANNNVTSGSVFHCISSLFDPRNWFQTARIAIKLVVLSTVISSSIDLYRARQNYSRSGRKIHWPNDRKIAGKLEFLLKDDSTSHIEILNGRG